MNSLPRPYLKVARFASTHRGHRLDAGGVDPGGGEAVVRRFRDRLLCARLVVIGHQAGLEEVATTRDRDDGATDPTGADEEDPHGHSLTWFPDMLEVNPQPGPRSSS